jgi:hypothetical protein
MFDTDTDIAYLEKIDEAIVLAAAFCELADIDHEDDEAVANAYEDRFHCGVCTTRMVMETVWPAVEEYITHLQARATAAEFVLETRTLLEGLWIRHHD